MERGNKGIGDILGTLTVAVLFIVIILLVVFAASSYRHSTVLRDNNDNYRAVLSYAVTAVKDHGSGAVEPRDYAGCPGLSIDAGSGYEHRLYLKDGKLLEEYAKNDMAADPENAAVIGETDRFEVSYITDSVLEIRTDLGTAYVDTGRQGGGI